MKNKNLSIIDDCTSCLSRRSFIGGSLGAVGVLSLSRFVYAEPAGTQPVPSWF